MSALSLVKENLKLSNIVAIATKGLSANLSISDLDCDCVDGDCSTDGYES